MSLKKTQFHAYHEEHGKLVEFAGFEMPIWYEGVIPEHHAVRDAVGIFDISHMGRATVRGGGSERFVNRMITNDLSALEPMSGLYTLMCNPRGGIVDDLIVYKLSEEEFMLVYNASNREKDLAWFRGHAEGFDVEVRDISDEVAMISLQGPRSPEALQRLCTGVAADLGRFELARVEVRGLDAMVARTGYTGEDGFEIFVMDAPVGRPEKALTIWSELLETGRGLGMRPCGLGARDSLRLEAGLCLYGNDIDEETNPLEARLRWVVKLKKPGGFIGREALLRAAERGVTRTRVGIVMEERGIPRQGYEIWDGDRRIGVVTSGGLSPTLGIGIAMGYIPPENAEIGTPVRVKIRDRLARGKVVKSHPFYDETRYGWRRAKA